MQNFIQNPEFSEFPTPIRPISVYESCDYPQPEFLQLPQPCRPTNFEQQNFESGAAGCSTAAEYTFTADTAEDAGETEAVDELMVILIECLEKVDTKSREFLMRKFFSELEKETNMERFIVERLKHSTLSELVAKIPERFDGGSTREIHVELSEKLEWFRIKNLNPGGVVQETKK